MKRITISAVAMATCITFPAAAANWVSDARGGGMGNTGVTTEDYLLAPFYNPALTAVYRENDDFGLLLPAINVNVRDKDDTLDLVDKLEDAYNANDTTAVQNYLNDLADNEDLNANAGAGLAIAIPNDVLSANIFARGYAEVLASATVDTAGATALDRYDDSRIEARAFGYYEYGVALAKKFDIHGQTFSFGVSPKIQQLKTYYDSATIEDYDLDDYDKSEVKKNTFNLDLGAVWLYENYRLGVAAKDLFSKSIKVQNTAGVQQDTYKLDTQVTFSAGYASEYFTAAFDIDATKQKRFEGSGDDTQFMRFGVEGNAWGWAQLRAGYEVDMESTIDNTVTVGLGISPGDVVSLDLAFSYADENQLGGALNLAFTF